MSDSIPETSTLQPVLIGAGAICVLAVVAFLLRRRWAGRVTTYLEKIKAAEVDLGVQKGTTGDIYVQKHCPAARRVGVLKAEDAALLGAIYLEAKGAAGRFGPREQALGETLASLIAPALRNARRFQEQGQQLARARRPSSWRRR